MRRVRPFPFDALPRLTRGQVAAVRNLLGHLPLGRPEPLARLAALVGGPVTVELIDAYTFPSREAPAWAGEGARLRVRASGDRAALVIVEAALAVRLARVLLGLPLDELPAPRPLAAAERGALALLVALLVDEEAVQGEEFLEPGADLAPLFPDPWVVVLEARVSTAIGGGWARLLCRDRLRLQSPRPRPPAALGERRHRLAAARTSLRLEVGRTRLPRPDFADLQPQDVVLFENFGPRPPFGGPVVLRLGHGGFPASLGGDGLTILDHFRLGAALMDKPPSTPPVDDGAAAASDGLLRELPVEVVCELGRVTMSGRELLELRPGAVVPVGRPLAGPVDLTVGGQVVARGELVDVEGEIGVRVTQLAD